MTDNIFKPNSDINVFKLFNIIEYKRVQTPFYTKYLLDTLSNNASEKREYYHIDDRYNDSCWNGCKRDLDHQNN